MDTVELYEIAAREHICIDSFDLGKREALSFMDSDGECSIAIDQRRIHSSLDEKMKLAHELGHCCTGSFYNQWATADCRRRHENVADKWAIQRFLSENDLDDAVANGFTEIWQLAEFFDVSEEFMKKAVCLYTYGNLAVELYF